MKNLSASVAFSKMSGNGNDFIVIDNRNGEADWTADVDFVKKVCARGMSVGADGLILIENSPRANFKWRFYNSDGTMPAMCGNGARCAARYAYINKIAPKEMTFETGAGIIEGFVMEGAEVKVLLTKPGSSSLDNVVMVGNNTFAISLIDTGVPHGVVFAPDIEKIDVPSLGAALRYHEDFAPAGINVNFVQLIDDYCLRLRTYERGVEGETLACGTGATASALIAIEKGLARSPVSVITASGKVLVVYYENGKIYLRGEGRLVYTGQLNGEAYNY